MRRAAGHDAGDLVRVAGARWAVEDLLDLGKGECGVDKYEVRSWVGWHRHVTLSLFALAVIRSRAAKPRRWKNGRARLIPLTVPEVCRLLLRLVWVRLTPVEQALA